MSVANTEHHGQEVAEALSPELVRQFADMATLIPAAEGDGQARIVEQILNAASWEDLDAPWETSDSKRILGTRMRVDAVVRQPSTIEGGLPFFLVVTATDIDTGEKLIWTTSSVSVVAQLVKAHVMGALPLYCELVQSDQATSRGYRPQHLKVHGTGDRGQQ